MDPLSMEKAMIKNMIDKTCKSIDERIEIVKKQNFLKHNEIVTFFKKRLFIDSRLCKFNCT